MSDFAGKIMIVTGAASGIGRAAADLLAARGAEVTGLGLLPDNMTPPTEWAFHQVDVTDPAAITAAVDEVISRCGGLDGVVTAAGIQRYGTVVETTDAGWQEVIAVNLLGVAYVLRATIPELRKRGGGSIVAVSSVQAMMTQQGVAAYAASKGAVNALVRATAVDEAEHGIRVNAVCPASVDTPMLRASARQFSDGTEEGAQRLVESWGRMHPVGRVADPRDVAGAIAYLLGPDSEFVTGTALPVDGGMLAVAPVSLET